MANILSDDFGLTVTFVNRLGVTESAGMRWNEIDRIVAYKRDIIMYDLICIAIADKNSSFELTEDMEGWDEVLRALSACLPGMPEYSAWWETVAKPAFATNQLVLFARQA